jgi:hypothetical protein
MAYRQMSYYAEANWNLVNEFQHPVSFDHTANAFGISVNAAIKYRVTKRSLCTLSAGRDYFATGNGKDTLYYKNGDVSVTKLNGVRRDQTVASVGLQFMF